MFGALLGCEMKANNIYNTNLFGITIRHFHHPMQMALASFCHLGYLVLNYGGYYVIRTNYKFENYLLALEYVALLFSQEQANLDESAPQGHYPVSLVLFLSFLCSPAYWKKFSLVH